MVSEREGRNESEVEELWLERALPAWVAPGDAELIGYLLVPDSELRCHG